MLELKDLIKYDDDTIANYHLIGEMYMNQCIVEKGSDDISHALEDTLTRIIEAGGTEEDIFGIMGARPIEEVGEDVLDGYYTFTDREYIIVEPIDYWKEEA